MPRVIRWSIGVTSPASANRREGIHYVPIKADLTDLYDVLAFFREGHDDLAKEIADEGKVWSKSFWRKEDMVSYQFRWVTRLGSRDSVP